MITKMLVDNYKGFCDEVFEFNKCNFFVGENSTGKTAIIDLIRNVYITQNPDFSGTDWQNAPYKSLISQDIEDKRAVISVCFSTIRNDDFTFRKFYQIIDRDGFPFIDKISFEIKKNRFIHIKHDNKQFRFSLSDLNIEIDNLYDFKEYCQRVTYKRKINRVIARRNLVPWDVIDYVLSSLKASNEEFIDEQINLFNTIFASNFRYTGPLRHIPEVYELQIKRDYDIQGKDLLFRYMQLVGNDKKISDKIDSFGIRSGLYDSFSYVNFQTQMPIVATTTTVSKNGIELPLKFHGTGLSQVMPIILDLYTDDDVLVSQPELHLHPKAQFELGKEIFSTVFSKIKRQFFIETHSDFIIDSVREEQFLMKSIYEYLDNNKDVVQKRAKESEKAIYNKKLFEMISNHLNDRFSLDTHKNIGDTIERTVSLYMRGYKLQSYISIKFFTNHQERVLNIGVEKDGSLSGDNLSEYRDFYMDYAFRGLSI